MKQKMLECQIQAWNRKPALRMLYVEWFHEIRSHLVPGITLEIGCGIGRLKKYIPGLFSVDIVKTPWTDVVGDAQELPFKAGNMSNLILFDVLHHLPRPLLFFFEALRILRNGGRVIIVEP
ncbi:MAG: class I SAM-dependent methyltransferase, partial [Proteobacteria bacterium]|nr:class I SAM-dependent methyltransferase [Pseudomonadota bacterium]